MSVPNLRQITDSTFEREVLSSDRPTVVGFWAQWSGSARLISSAVREFADRYADELKTVWLNVDEDAKTPSTYGVKTLPTLLVFRDGEVQDRLVGGAPKETIHELFRSARES
jgi:thioredoxin 1